MRRVAPIVVVLVTALSCGPQQRVPQCSPSATQTDKQPILITFEAQRVEVDMVLPPAVFCENGNPVASRADTEVLTSANELLEHSQGAVTSSDTKGYATTIGFVPPAPGVYYLTARFEPSLGVARRQVQVLRDRTREAAAVRVPLTALCDEVSGLDDAALCRRGGELSLLRPDASVVLATGVGGVQSVGGVAWWWTGAALTRAVPAGDGGLGVTSLQLTVTPPVGVRADLFTSNGGGELLEVFVAGDGGLGKASRPLPAGTVLAGPGLSRQGEVVGYATATQLCALGAASADASVPVRCVESLGFTPAQGERDVVWLRGVETGLVGLARVTSARSDPEVRFLPAQSPAMTDTRQGLPAFTWAGYFLAVRAEDLTLEAFLPPPGVARRGVTAEHVVFQTREELVVYRR